MAEKNDREEGAQPAGLPEELSGLSEQEWAAKHARLLAEFDNFRKRTREESDRRASAQKQQFISELLGVIDNFERAIEAARDADSTFAEGMRAIDRQLRDLLAAHGIKPMDARGKPFDFVYHEAVGMVEDPQLGPGMVSEVLQNGWLSGDDVLRHARVLVTGGE